MPRDPNILTIDLSAHIEKLQGEQRTHRDKADEIVAKTIAEDREFTKEEEAALAEHQGKIVTLGKRMDLLKKQSETRASLEKPGERRTGRDKPANPRRDPTDPDDDDDDDLEKREKQYRSAYSLWLRGGMSRLNEEQRSLLQEHYTELPTDDAAVRDMSSVTGATGGFTVPQGFIADIEKAMKDFSGVRKSRAQVMPTDSGNDIPWPTVNDTANEGEMVAENTTTSTDTGPSIFGQVMLKSYLFSSKLILLPIQLIQDSGVNIESLLSALLGERLGRATNRKFTVGTGANEPQGIVTGSALGKQVAGAAAITYAEMIDMQHSVDPAYRGNAEWMFHDTTFALLRKLLDSDGRPIWQPAMVAGMADGAPGTLLGAKYQYNNHMAVPASGAKSVLYGDMSKYKIREVKNLVIVRLAERYAEKFQVGFFGFLRADGRHVNAGSAIKHLLHP